MHIYDLLGAYKAREFLRLLEEWFPGRYFHNVLKTDLNEEAHGADQILFSLVDKCAHAYGVDIDPETVRKASLRAKNDFAKECRCLSADVRHLPMEDDFFDLILSVSTCDHFERVGDLTRSLEELRRVLKKGGHLVMALNNRHNKNFYWSLKIARALRFIPYPVNFYRMEEMKEKLREAGFTVLDTSYLVNVVSPMNSLCIFLGSMLPRGMVDRIATRAIKKKKGHDYAWFIVAKCAKQ